MAEGMISPSLGKVLEGRNGFQRVAQLIDKPTSNPFQEGKSGVTMRGEGNG